MDRGSPLLREPVRPDPRVDPRPALLRASGPRSTDVVYALVVAAVSLARRRARLQADRRPARCRALAGHRDADPPVAEPGLARAGRLERRQARRRARRTALPRCASVTMDGKMSGSDQPGERPKPGFQGSSSRPAPRRQKRPALDRDRARDGRIALGVRVEDAAAPVGSGRHPERERRSPRPRRRRSAPPARRARPRVCCHELVAGRPRSRPRGLARTARGTTSTSTSIGSLPSSANQALPLVDEVDATGGSGRAESAHRPGTRSVARSPGGYAVGERREDARPRRSGFRAGRASGTRCWMLRAGLAVPRDACRRSRPRP